MSYWTVDWKVGQSLWPADTLYLLPRLSKKPLSVLDKGSR